ncbi:hypothetical protein KPB05_23030 [Burkholderia gladioli]|uniref:hypothetical protein n=1 Tax=Burkholderia gladioli TaxID=28095 RepID=UPI00285B1F88|nr:hypothetical protein [Burkholderia gladioli]MDR8090336.1 hypothetical protein [Burkholderia gladioli]
MDEIARGIGYAAIEIGASVLIFVALIVAASKSQLFPRACKIALLLTWMLSVTVAPVYGLTLTWQKGDHVAAILIGIIFIFPGPLPFFVIGWPELVKAVRGVD